MIKTIVSIALALLILAGLSACTQNNGHIGRRFGMWKLLRIEIDGQTDTEYQENLFWSFQSNVIEIKRSDGMDGFDSCFGRCDEIDDKLILDFKNHDDLNPPGYAYYTPPAATHLPGGKVLTLSILKLTRTDMKLMYYNPDDDKAYIYILKKWG